MLETSLTDHHTEEILGRHIIGTDALMLEQEVGNAMRMHFSVDAITQAIYVHPALPEVGELALESLPR
jgi:pyruvate/2-oxoglutarate dehydrogenase complex dihydrolipoamide dehydrogenase (E3) component